MMVPLTIQGAGPLDEEALCLRCQLAKKQIVQSTTAAMTCT